MIFAMTITIMKDVNGMEEIVVWAILFFVLYVNVLIPQHKQHSEDPKLKSGILFAQEIRAFFLSEDH